MGEAKPYFERFEHPTHHVTGVAINGALPRYVGTGFAEVQEWEFDATCHSVIPAKFGRHFADASPDAALGIPCGVWLAEVCKSQGSDVSFRRQNEVW